MLDDRGRFFIPVPWSVVVKLLLKSSGVTLLPLLVKETSYFYSVIHFSLLQLLGTIILNVTKSLLAAAKSI
jgi:hypothetical protein